MNAIQRELEALFNVADWAAYNGYADILTKTVGEISEKGGSIPEDSALENRLRFMGCKSALTGKGDVATKLTDSLQFLDDLHEKFEGNCTSADTNSFQWVRVRQLILSQLAILKLKARLNMDELYSPPEPKDIMIPTGFKIADFRSEIEALFKMNRRHVGNNAIGKVENEYSSYFSAMLTQLFQPNAPAARVRYGLFCLLHQHNMETFQHETTTFLRKVEKEVLPIPPALASTALTALVSGPQEVLAPSRAPVTASSSSASASASASIAARSTMETLQRDAWSDDRRAKSGPYAPSPSSKKHASPAKSPVKPRRKGKRMLREVEEYEPSKDGDDTDEQSSQQDDGSESPSKVRRSHRLNPAEATDATKVADSLAANRKQFVASMAKKDPLADALGVSDLHPVKSSVGGRKTRNSAAIAIAVEIEPKKGEADRAEDGQGEAVQVSSKTKTSVNSSPGNSRAESSSGAASGAAARPSAEKKKRSMLDPSSRATKVEFSELESDSDVDSDFEEGGRSVAAIQSRIKVGAKVAFPKKLQADVAMGPPSHTSRPGGKRVFWTADEEDALRVGIAEHGVGNWATILADSSISYRFQGRTSVNLKDKYRNLVLQNAI